LSDEQIYALLKACNKKSWEGFRDYVILLTFLDTGIRLSELINLTIRDINLNKRKEFSLQDRDILLEKDLFKR
jgi:integrase